MSKNRALWIDHSFDKFRNFTKYLRNPLFARFENVSQRLSRMNGGKSIETALCSPSATPFVALIDAYRSDLGFQEDDPQLIAVGEATLYLYLYVRVQDDIVDEPALFDRANVYLAEVFSSKSTTSFAKALHENTEFFTFREKVMLDFSQVATWEVDNYCTGKEDLEKAISLIGKKFLPMVLPLGALSCIKKKHSDLDTLVQFVQALGTGLQMINDILNIVEDFTGKRLTPILQWLLTKNVIKQEQTPFSVRAALLGNEILKQALDVARKEISNAILLAQSLQAKKLENIAQDRLSFVDTIPKKLIALCLRVEAA